jgi:hypothetical protein
VGEVATGALPELALVPWRPRADDRALVRSGRRWTLTTAAHVVPFVLAAAGLMLLNPLAFPVSLACLAHAWIVPGLYARRGANVVLPARTTAGAPEDPDAERVATGLVGDLVDHDTRDLYARTGLVLEPGTLGAWLVGEGGAVLVRPGGRRVLCWCATARGATDLPRGDRIAHLLLALRADEAGFATVANLSFSGARWRLRERLQPRQREALSRARALAAA